MGWLILTLSGMRIAGGKLLHSLYMLSSVMLGNIRNLYDIVYAGCGLRRYDVLRSICVITYLGCPQDHHEMNTQLGAHEVVHWKEINCRLGNISKLPTAGSHHPSIHHQQHWYQHPCQVPNVSTVGPIEHRLFVAFRSAFRRQHGTTASRSFLPVSVSRHLALERFGEAEVRWWRS